MSWIQLIVFLISLLGGSCVFEKLVWALLNYGAF